MSEAFDETSEHLRLELPGGNRSSCAISAWHVLVAIASIVASSAHEEEEMLDVIRPPVALLGTNANLLCAGRSLEVTFANLKSSFKPSAVPHKTPS